MFYCCGVTNKGARENNEDAFLIKKSVVTEGELSKELDSPFVVAVADGVAGETSGEIASAVLLKHLGKLDVKNTVDFEKKILDYHKQIRRHGIVSNNLNMQTTLCALVVKDDKTATIINVGDSKLYRYRGGELRQLSTDQSFVQMLYEQGEITEEEKRKHKHRNIIFPVIGNLEEDPKIEVTEIIGGILPGDVFLILTDGIADYVSKGDIENILALPQKLPKRISAILELAGNNKSTDNLTVVAVSGI